MEKSTPIWKIAATSGGVALTGVATWLNAVHVAEVEGWQSPLVFAGIAVTVCCAAAVPFAERCAKEGQPLKASLLALFFALGVAFSLSASISRSSGYQDGKVAGAEKQASNATLATEAYKAAQVAHTADCATGRGNRCRKAEDKLTEARNALAAAPASVATDPGAERLAAVLGVEESAVQMFAPLFLPIALELGGFIFLAAGLAPRRREEDVVITDAIDTGVSASEPQPEPVAIATPATAKRGSSAYYLQRLQRDHPAIATKVATGEISVYAASIAAGLRKAPAKQWTKVSDYAGTATADA